MILGFKVQVSKYLKVVEHRASETFPSMSYHLDRNESIHFGPRVW